MDGAVIRARLGAWLLRPYLAGLVRHYTLAGNHQRLSGRYEEARNCDYICIGLQYAANPSRGCRR